MTDSLHEQLQTALGPGFTIKREIGGGGMSRVFLVEDVKLRRLVVVKLLPQELAAELSTARFHREIQLAARLQHPHIVPLISTGDAAGVPYYTMPFIDGESLRDRMQRSGELTVPESIRLLREIASALAYAHDRGVVHRDIKPENILLTDGVALVADFGVAKALIESTTMGERPLTAAGMAVGTPAYMSPEQVSADPSIDQRADLYSFGAVAYEMLTGRPPFMARTTQALLAAHVVETPEYVSKRRPSIPPDLANLIMRCLEKRQADRPQSATEVVRALDNIQTTTPSGTPAVRSSDFLNTVAEVPVSRVRVYVAGIAFALLAAAGLWYLRSRPATKSAAVFTRVLIAPFVNLTGDTRYDHVGVLAADRLALSTAQVGLDVVPPSTVTVAMRDTSLGRAEQLKRLTAAAHAAWLVTGSVYLRGDSLQLSTQIINTATGSAAQTLPMETGAASDPIAAIDLVGDRLKAELSSKTRRTILPTGFRTPRYEAYKEVLAGFDAFAMHGDIYGSRPHLRRAIELDSQLVQAYTMLARQYLNAGEYATADSVLLRITSLRLPMTPTEKDQYDYHRAELDGSNDRMIESSRSAVARDSNALSLYLLGEGNLYLLRTREAIKAITAARPTFVVMGGQALVGTELTLAKAMHVEERYSDGLNVLKEHASLYPGDVRLRGGMLREVVGLRDTVQALAIVDSMLNENLASNSASTVSWLITGIEELRVHIDSAFSQRVARRLIDRMRSSPALFNYPPAFFDRGSVFMMAGMPDSAAATFQLAVTRGKRIDAAGFLGVARAQNGDKQGARFTADSLGALKQPFLLGVNTYWKGVILAAVGDRDAAIQLLQQSVAEGRTMDKWHYAPELNSLRGYPAFEQLLKPHN